jgi:phosphoglycerate dehydrogenase-like enzyme
MKVLIVHHHRFELWHAPAWLRERLQSAFPEIKVVQFENFERIFDQIRDTDAFIGFSLRPEQFTAATKLRWIHSPAAAVHQLMFPELVGSDVVVTNSTSVHGPVVAEHAIAVLLALAKRLPGAMHYQRERKWAQALLWQEHPRPREVAGTTVLVLGMGGIGAEFAVRAKALGMKVLAVRESPSKGAGAADAVFPLTQLEQLLPQTDFILLCAPVTPATQAVINAERLRKMKKDAYVINVSRGPLIDDAALLAALREKRIGGAALDVFTEEPLPPESPFWELENVLITPHTAAVTERLWERHYDLIVENLKRFMSGKKLLNEVDKKKGY